MLWKTALNHTVQSIKINQQAQLERWDAFLSILSNTSKYVVIDSTKFILLKDDMVVAQFELEK